MTTGQPGRRAARPAATRSPWIPGVAAWLFPGAGHLLVGRVIPGLVFAGVILTTFCTGLVLNGTVYAMDAEQPLSYLATFANLGVGPLDTVARLSSYGHLRYRIPDTRVDRVTRERVFKILRRRIISPSHAYGRTFLLTAGLMNLLLILDVFDICIGRKKEAEQLSDPEGTAASSA
ncbi:MAG: DUF6677 family protein [Acidobacteriota bacterium]